jgi:site-specific DNA-methyltransferase (adenine-specific)
VVARKPVEGTVAQNVLTYGVGGLNIDGSRVGTGTGETKTIAYPDIRGGNLGQDSESYTDRDKVVREVKDQGRFPANILLTHNADCEQVGEVADKMVGGFGNGGIGIGETGQEGNSGKDAEWVERSATTPVYQCSPGCPVAALDQQSGESKSTPTPDSKRSSNIVGDERSSVAAGMYGEGALKVGHSHNDAGGASRFFTNTEYDLIDETDPFYYSAKASKKERPLHPETGKGHPTVKPLEVMRWLIKLVTPAGGTILEPFAGSGATVEAALLDGYKIIAIDITADHMPLIDIRIDRVLDGTSPGLKKKPAGRKRGQSENNPLEN